MNPRKKRLLTGLSVYLAFTVAAAGFFAFIHHDHDCTGEDCPHCLQLETAKRALKALGLAGAAALFSMLLASGSTREKAVLLFCAVFPTLISLKVRFNS